MELNYEVLPSSYCASPSFSYYQGEQRVLLLHDGVKKGGGIPWLDDRTRQAGRSQVGQVESGGETKVQS